MKPLTHPPFWPHHYILEHKILRAQNLEQVVHFLL